MIAWMASLAVKMMPPSVRRVSPDLAASVTARSPKPPQELRSRQVLGRESVAQYALLFQPGCRARTLTGLPQKAGYLAGNPLRMLPAPANSMTQPAIASHNAGVKGKSKSNPHSDTADTRKVAHDATAVHRPKEGKTVCESTDCVAP